MIKNIFIAAVLLMTSVLCTSCYYDKEEDLYPVKVDSLNNNNSACDTTNVKYSTTVKPIMDTWCTGCHNSGSFNFTGHTPLSTYLTGNSQKFINNISYTSAQPMPPSGKLSDCDILKIKTWIQAGFPNN